MFGLKIDLQKCLQEYETPWYAAEKAVEVLDGFLGAIDADSAFTLTIVRPNPGDEDVLDEFFERLKNSNIPRDAVTDMRLEIGRAA